MSRTIEEIRQYFGERPELRAKVNEELRIMRGEDFLNVDSWMVWAKDNVPGVYKRFGAEYAVWNTVDVLLNALSRIDARNLTLLPKEEYPMGEEYPRESVKYPVMGEILNDNSLTKEFQAWFVGERQECEEAGFKGFNKDLTRLGFQYEVGKEYEHEGQVWRCESGFHACEKPLDVLRFYNGIDNRYCIVSQWGYMDKIGEKRVSSNIKIEKEISLKKLFEIGAEKMSAIPYGEDLTEEEEASVGEGTWKIVESLPYREAVEGIKSNIILRENRYCSSWVTGTDNIIGIMKYWTHDNISGDGNKVYIFGNGNTVSITGMDNLVSVIEGERNRIIVSGDRNEVRAKGKVDVTLVGYDNSVVAGMGSTIVFNVRGNATSVVVDGEKITPNMKICFRNGQIEELKLDNIL